MAEIKAINIHCISSHVSFNARSVNISLEIDSDVTPLLRSDSLRRHTHLIFRYSKKHLTFTVISSYQNTIMKMFST